MITRNHVNTVYTNFPLKNLSQFKVTVRHIPPTQGRALGARSRGEKVTVLNDTTTNAVGHLRLNRMPAGKVTVCVGLTERLEDAGGRLIRVLRVRFVAHAFHRSLALLLVIGPSSVTSSPAIALGHMNPNVHSVVTC